MRVRGTPESEDQMHHKDDDQPTVAGAITVSGNSFAITTSVTAEKDTRGG